MSLISKNPRVLVIGGSDSSAGAGIQADLKTISALGGYACTAITALTVQNTQGVKSLNPTSPEILLAQCEAILEDIDIHAVKIGMLPDAESVEIVSSVLTKYQPEFVVWDPVLVATSGDGLTTEDIVNVAVEKLLPHVHVVTPNLHELADLTNSTEAAVKDAGLVEAQCQVLLNRGARAVLAKGGHFEADTATDWLFTAQGFSESYVKSRIETKNTHGSGCTFASAIACLRPQLPNLSEAIRAAKNYVQDAIESSANWRLGKGRGPLDHFCMENLSLHHFSAS
ncbi:MAG: bifunctional hydroxymethylpyrimidine kinase/phosphomethylpyrimidine kinase [Neisseriaceae bacterium]|nr:bifunctional hydroxymethylpyrimidine kinase/phosphomethylpyrimidine kinase [Neisseriaceae bacterium]